MPGHHARFVHPVRCKKNVRHAAQGASEAASSVSGRTCHSSDSSIVRKTTATETES
jgi:hypothetical protein